LYQLQSRFDVVRLSAMQPASSVSHVQQETAGRVLRQLRSLSSVRQEAEQLSSTKFRKKRRDRGGHSDSGDGHDVRRVSTAERTPNTANCGGLSSHIWVRIQNNVTNYPHYCHDDNINIFDVNDEHNNKKNYYLYRSIRVHARVDAVFACHEEGTDVWTRVPAYFILLVQDINGAKEYDIDTLASEFDKRVENFEARGSDFVIERVVRVMLCISKFCPLHGSSYVPTSKRIAGKHCVVNVKNDDRSWCFIWAVPSCLYPAANHVDKIYNYRPYIFSGPPPMLPHHHIRIRLIWPLNFYIGPLTSMMTANLCSNDVQQADAAYHRVTTLCTWAGRGSNGRRGSTVSVTIRLLPRQLSAAYEADVVQSGSLIRVGRVWTRPLDVRTVQPSDECVRRDWLSDWVVCKVKVSVFI